MPMMRLCGFALVAGALAAGAAHAQPDGDPDRPLLVGQIYNPAGSAADDLPAPPSYQANSGAPQLRPRGTVQRVPVVLPDPRDPQSKPKPGLTGALKRR